VHRLTSSGKSEARNPKSETNPKSEFSNVRNLEATDESNPSETEAAPLFVWVIRIWVI
jgi:hypothetical protein